MSGGHWSQTNIEILHWWGMYKNKKINRDELLKHFEGRSIRGIKEKVYRIKGSKFINASNTFPANGEYEFFKKLTDMDFDVGTAAVIARAVSRSISTIELGLNVDRHTALNMAGICIK